MSRIQKKFLAREMLSYSLIWRKKHGVDKILSEYKSPEVVKKYFPGKEIFFLHLLNLSLEEI